LLIEGRDAPDIAAEIGAEPSGCRAAPQRRFWYFSLAQRIANSTHAADLGLLRTPELGKVPHQRRTAFALHRVGETQ
jgi:hypothetical protein